MKRLMILFLATISWELQAQVIITQSNFPTAGTTIYRNVNETAVEFDPGLPGPGNVWSYGGLTSDSMAIYNFINPSATPYASNYPGTNLALEIATDLYAYLNVSNGGATELGFAGDGGAFDFGGINIVFKYNPELTLMPFPAQYGTNFSGTSKGEIRLPAAALGINQPGLDSVMVKRTVTRTGNFDASGSLTVNTEFWQDALRYRKFDEIVDSFFVQFFGNWIDASALGASPMSSTELTYEWYVNGHNFPVLTAEMNAIGDTALTREYYAPGTSKSKNKNTVFTLYPNPASNVIYFSGDLTNVQSIVVYNTLGQKLDYEAITNNNQIEISLNGFSNGIYIYQVIDKDSKVLSSGKFMVEK